MKPILEKIIGYPDQSFSVRVFEEKYFTSPWHFHPEIEIILITEGYGTRFVGDSVKNFYPGDVCIIGSNTPHVFLCNNDFYKPDSSKTAKAICIQFDETFWGSDFMKLAELIPVKKLLASSKRGIRFIKNTQKLLEELLLEFPDKIGASRISHLLQILEVMASAKDQIILSSPNYANIKINDEDIGRMEILFDYVFQNYNREIRIDEVAEVLHISKNSFCRYFKSRTNKVFSAFLSEVRVGNACKLLIENKLNVTQICYESGFNNVSNFYRQFKQIKKVTPTEFQKKYLNSMYLEPRN